MKQRARNDTHERASSRTHQRRYYSCCSLYSSSCIFSHDPDYHYLRRDSVSNRSGGVFERDHKSQIQYHKCGVSPYRISKRLPWVASRSLSSPTTTTVLQDHALLPHDRPSLQTQSQIELPSCLQRYRAFCRCLHASFTKQAILVEARSVNERNSSFKRQNNKMNL